MSNHLDPLSSHEDSHRTIVLVAYILGAVGVLTAFIPIFVALVLCYVKRGESVNTIYYSHYDWLISTFWIGMFWFVISVVLWLVGIGIIIYVLLGLWLLYRFTKGLLRLLERKAVV